MVKPKTDPRFEKVFKDPRFKRISKSETKVKIDSRFEKMFTDERFHTKYTVDKRGRKVDAKEKEDLHKFYDLESDEKSQKRKKKDGNFKNKSKDDTKMKKKKSKIDQKKLKRKSDQRSLNDTPEDDTREPTGELENNLDDSNSDDDKPDFADIRGRQVEDKTAHSSSESSSDSEMEEVQFEDLEDLVHGWGELDEDAQRIESAETFRLAVCNCDWDRITASDLYVLFNSFKPTGGSIRSVKIYVSDFGRERLKEEEISGPKELKEATLASDEESDNNEEGNVEGSGYHMEKLREYQLNRMKYYYAVVECNDIQTADKLYEVCDGMEYEMSGTRLDLRFIPDDMTFDDNEPTSVANEALNLKNYEPTNFLNTALQQSTVRLTWDEADPKRVQNTMRKFTKEDIENMDFRDYIASSSSEDEEQVKRRKQKIKENKRVGSHDDDDGSEDGVSSNELSDDEEESIRKYRVLMEEINAKEKQEEQADDSDNDVDIDATRNDNKGYDGNDDGKNNDGDVLGNDEDDASIDGDDDTSNDNVKDSGFDDPFFQQQDDVIDDNDTKQKQQKKKKKKKSQNESLTEEEKTRQKELELLIMDEEDDKSHFSLKGILDQEKLNKKSGNKRKRRKLREEVKQDDFEFNTKDERFNALYDSHLYSIDPSGPNFKKTKATEAIIKEAQKRREKRATDSHVKAKLTNDQASEAKSTSSSTASARLSALVSSVKSKTLNHQIKKKKRKLK